MRIALKLAGRADPFPNPRVGAVLAKGGQIIGTGFHKAPGMRHAEIEAIEDAKRRTKDPHAARGATLYVTLEPCSHTAKRTPPCTDAIIRGGIAKVVYAMKDPNPLVSGAKALGRAGLEVEGPTDAKAAARLNRRYIAAIFRKPFVAIKMAMSADGKTATRTGESKWISSEKSRAMVHRMRAEYGAVMAGAGTIAADDPELTAHGKGQDPYRIVIDGSLSISLKAKVLQKRDGKTIIVASEMAEKAKALAIERKGARVLICGGKEVDLRKLLFALRALGMKKVLIEGGSGLNAKALDAGIVDRLLLFIAPKIIGGKMANGVIGGKGAALMRQALPLKGMKIKKIGPDFLLEADLSG
jgi:diaminohydroxyphosphoribosylaminopyrimidine deaminase/5-amino-6-(5-phosphoribosylamino)uracil reductase